MANKLMPREYYRAANFKYTITDMSQSPPVEIGANRVASLGRSLEEYTYREGHETEFEHKLVGQGKAPDLTIERAIFKGEPQTLPFDIGNSMAADDYFDTWYDACADNGSGTRSNTEHRRDLIIELKDRTGAVVRTWSAENCTCKEITYTDLDAVGGNEVEKEMVVLSCEYLGSVAGSDV